MPLPVDQIAKEALALPNQTRAQLAEQLVESLEIDEDTKTRGLWLAEAIRRRDEVRSGKVKPIEGKKVLAEVRRLVGR